MKEENYYQDGDAVAVFGGFFNSSKEAIKYRNEM